MAVRGLCGAMIVGLLFSAAPGLARPWAYLTASRSGDEIWIDLGSISQHGTLRRAWTRWERNHPESSGAVQTLTFLAFDCASSQSAIMHFVKYNRDGEVVGRDPAPGRNLQWNPVVPDSTGDAELRFVCSYPIGTDWRQIDGLRVEQ